MLYNQHTGKQDFDYIHQILISCEVAIPKRPLSQIQTLACSQSYQKWYYIYLSLYVQPGTEVVSRLHGPNLSSPGQYLVSQS